LAEKKNFIQGKESVGGRDMALTEKRRGGLDFESPLKEVRT